MKWLLTLALFSSVMFGGTVPGYYILQLKGKPAAERVAGERLANRRAAALRQRGAVSAEQAAFRRKAGVRDTEVVSALNLILNALVLRVDERRANQLAQHPDVASISPAREMELAMDRAIGLQKATQAWDLIGGPDKAGAGIKIGVIDSGIDSSHPAFQDPNLTIPDGFPMVSTPDYIPATTNKVIVARSYEQFYNAPVPTTFTDSTGHGTGVSMCAAASQHVSPIGPISGIAPKAWLGAYKVFVNGIATGNDVAVMQALEDAVADGMDVVNLSLGFSEWFPPVNIQNVPFVLAVEQASAMGVLVVNAAGNFGPERSTTTLLAPSAIGVGAAGNDRVFGGPVTLDDGTSYISIPQFPTSNFPAPISAMIADMRTFDPSGEPCAALPPASLTGRIAVLTLGVTNCALETKLNHVQDAGAVAALVYAGPGQPEVNSFDIGTANLPSVGLSNADGLAILSKFQANSNMMATITFAGDPITVDSNRMASFSSRGPDPNDLIRPDVSAIGQYLYMAAPNGSYVTAQGTSFAAPQVTGAAAILKAARPGLSGDQYRSLLANNATPIRDSSGTLLPVMYQGAGLLNVAAAVSSTLTAAPRSISFGSGTNINSSRDLTIGNLGTADDTLTLSIFSDSPTSPTLSASSLAVAAGGTVTFSVGLAVPNPAPGEYQGFVHVQAASGSEIRIPYWFGVPSGVPASVKASLLNPVEPGGPPQVVILFRAMDAIGIPVTDPAPTVRVLSGPARVESVVYQKGYRALAGVVASFTDPGTAVFRIQSGDVQKDVRVGSSVPDTPRIVLTQTSLDFGNVLSGFTKDLTFTVGNRGGSPLSVASISGSNDALRVTSATSFNVAKGAPQTVTVRFSPTSAGALTGALTIQSNDPTQPTATIQVVGTAIAATGPFVLQVDSGTFNSSIGFPSGFPTAYFVNRLTPPKYPATLQNVQIYFGDRSSGLNQDTAITVVSGASTGGTANINGVTLQRTSATVGKLGTFTTYTVPSVTITSGDFVVGFLVNNPPNIFPADQDKTVAGHSYVSTDGASFSLIDSVAPGNFGIRATVVFK